MLSIYSLTFNDNESFKYDTYPLYFKSLDVDDLIDALYVTSNSLSLNNPFKVFVKSSLSSTTSLDEDDDSSKSLKFNESVNKSL